MTLADPRTAETVIFDLDTTLVLDMEHAQRSFTEAAAAVAPDDPAPLAAAALDAARDIWRASEHVSLGKALGIASWEVLWADFDGCHPILEPMQEWAPAFRREVWSTAVAAVGLAGADPEVAAGAFVEAQRRAHPLVPGGIEALRALASMGRRVALLTNGPPDIQRHKLSHLDCESLLSAVVVSGEVGVGKPDPAIFSLTLEAVGAESAGTVMVGDSWNRDVEGARGSGIAAVWLSFGRPVPDGGLDNVVVVDETDQLGEALGC